MKRVKSLFKSMVSLLLGGLLVTSCQSEDFSGPIQAEGKGTITLDLNAIAGFDTETKAVNEADYKNVDNYTVSIFDENDSPVLNKTFSEIKGVAQTLERGSYKVKAYYGEEKNASRDIFYVFGQETFSIMKAEENKLITLDCKPTCAKCLVEFDSNMATYFSDYYVTYETNLISGNTAKWAKEDTTPWYLKVNKDEEIKAIIHLTVKDGYESQVTKVEKTVTISPNETWLLKVAANYKVTEGELGITITVDETTEDIPIDVEVPDSWL